MGGFAGPDMPAESCAIIPLPPKRGDHRGGWLTRQSVIIFGLKGIPFPYRARARRATVSRSLLNGKIGFLLNRGQRLKNLTLRGFKGGSWNVVPSRKVKKELVAALGRPRHQEWAGFEVQGPSIDPPYPLYIKCSYRIRVGKIGKAGWFQALPLVFGFKVVGFDKHYLLGVSVLKRDLTPVTTFTAQPSPKSNRVRS